MLSSHKENLAPRVGFFRCEYRAVSALTGFEPALGLVDHIDPTLTAHDATIAVTLLERAERVLDLHGLSPSSRRGRRASRFHLVLADRFMVGGTGIEPVTPTMST